MGALTAADVVAWTAAHGVRPGGRLDIEQMDVGALGMALPAMPHRYVAVYPAPGTPDSHEGVVDGPAYQFVLRWDPGDPAGAERAAKLLDRIVRDAGAESGWIGDPDDPAWLLYLTRTGGGPAPLGDERSNGDRPVYATTYLFVVAEYPH